MRKGLLASISLALCIVLSFVILFNVPIKTNSIFKDVPDVIFKVEDKKIVAIKGEDRSAFDLKGVNIGAGYPGSSSKYNKIKKSVFLNWFKDIADMNANTIYLGEIQSPEFYVAIKEYNKRHDKKLYIVQTFNISDDIVYGQDNILEEKSLLDIYSKSEDYVDAIHGDKIIVDNETQNMYCYISDVSEYIISYALGASWNELFVEYTNNINSGKYLYKGKYFESNEYASAFERFLAKWADHIAVYEKEKYNEQHIMSFGNTAETDPFINDIKLSESELEPTIDVNHIVDTADNSYGHFVSYSVLPYYPLFLQIGKYTKYVDESGTRNSYRKYLSILNEHHKCPVVISSFGVPASRNVTQSDYLRGFSHGGLNENDQAKAYVDLYDDIKKSGCAGAATISWQDEWYRSTWNEKALSSNENRPFWCNVQSSELFGLLAFDVESEDYNVYPDDDFLEWDKKDIVYSTDNLKLSMKTDFKYLHIMVDGIDLNKGNSNYINIALDISPDYGRDKIGDMKLSRNADFIIQISKNNISALYVDEDYDVLSYSILTLFENKTVGGLAQLKKRYESAHTKLNENDKFNIVSRADENTFSILNSENEINNVGILKQGNANPKSEKYDSNADYFIKDNKVHVRIPWQLINFYNPNEFEIIDNLEENSYELKGKNINEIYAGAFYDSQKGTCNLKKYSLGAHNSFKFYERLKPSYYEMQKAFGGEIS